MTNANINSQLIAAIASGEMEVVDLTETLTPEYPTIQLPEEFAQAWPFKSEQISKYDDNGPAWYWNNVSFSEHTGTHFDAPIHWITGRDLENNSVDTISPENFIAPVNVVDCSAVVRENLGFILTKEFLLSWESQHGKIEPGSWVFLRSDWRHVAPEGNFTNMQEDGAHSPGPDPEAVLWLIKERDILGFGTETVGTDAGQAFNFEPQYPAHYYVHGAGKYGLQCMTNLDRLPPRGAVILAAPLKIQNGSGSPLRVLALTPKE